MALSGSLQLSHDLGLCKNHDVKLCGSHRCNRNFLSVMRMCKLPLLSTRLSSHCAFRQQDSWHVCPSRNSYRPIHFLQTRSDNFRCHSLLVPGGAPDLPSVKAASGTLTRSYNVLHGSPLILKVAPAVAVIIFAIWGLGPLMRHSRNLLFHKNDNSWKKSDTHYVMSSYLQPLLLWVGTTLICRALDPVVMPTGASQLVKQRLLNFVRSLSTVLTFAYCLSGVIQKGQKFFLDSKEPNNDTRNMGLQFAGKAVYSAVWVAAFALFMELLGFSTQKWLTAGGLGTVLLTLAGREIFTNFLSSAMIHATRPFVVNEWIQTKIEGYEVSGTVERVGWWSPTIIRAEDREAVHIPNHKFTVNVVRNLSQKTHWRIKTHLAISHLDVNKINNIVADMRKVLAKNPQVEQQRLHRRVFLENVNQENQALVILISCFVKTSHHEEYLCVKEAILLDLLRVISHHRARLATPIRTVQKFYSDAEFENGPFSDSTYNQGGMASNRPLLLIEPPYRINGEEKAKSQTRSGRVAVEQETKATSRSTHDLKVGVNSKTDSKNKETPKSDIKADSKNKETPKSDIKADTTLNSDVKNTKAAPVSTSEPCTGDKMNVVNSNAKATGVVSNSIPENKKTSDPRHRKISSPENARQIGKVDSSSIASEATPKAGGVQDPSHLKLEDERKSALQAPMSKPALEENIVLGVALDGSKRTLPIEEDMSPHLPPLEVKETAAAGRNATGLTTAEKDGKDGQPPTAPNTASGNQ
ncbi:hypothetical protein K2173_014795 [Erythroxylum novogranatense]|uniref:Mechanosensitive ion channel protein 2, chloroplastic-like n=1 Tax=Erythroxylum novogranatense TaxID=1862640 RepID=A0AAV8TG37_9ROSI|nr:hypothetical protein K2173_014795 [Erythroxylum novogranatense]